MINNDSIQILILYKLFNHDKWFKLLVSIGDYYDKNYIDENEVIEIDTIPLFNNAIDYIDKKVRKDVVYTKLSIINITNNSKREINTTYWNCQKNSISERIDIDFNGAIIFNEIIITTFKDDDAQNDYWEIIRFVKEENLLMLKFHTLIIENEDGLVSEKIIL